jgi:hypothetical protein
MPERSNEPPFYVGDQVLTPDDRTATVTYLAPDGRVAIETPWSAQWEQFAPADLTLLVRHAE